MLGQTLSKTSTLAYKGIMMKKIEQVIILGLLSISVLLKVGSVIVLYQLYTHTEEILHDLAHKTKIKKIKGQTHEPIQ